MTLAELAERLGVTLQGDGSREITGVAGLDQAGPNDITFLANPKYAAKVKQTRAAAVLVTTALPDAEPASLISANPYLDFARALSFFYQPPRPAHGIHPLAYVSPQATIGEGASIGPFAVVSDNVMLGRNATLYSHAVVYPGAQIGDDFTAHSHAVVREFCRIGHRVTLQPGVVIGGDGFGFATHADQTHYKIPQTGVTVLEDDVEVQSLSSIDRATMGETRIRRGAKIDSLVQIGHACDVGENSRLCGQAGLAGSSTLGKNVLLAGQVGVAGHLKIGDNVVAYAQSGIPNDVRPNSRIAGYPAMDNIDWLKAVGAFPKLPDLLKTVRQLEKKVAALEQLLATKPNDSHE